MILAASGTGMLVIGLLSISARYMYMVPVKTIDDAGSIRLVKPAADATEFIWSQYTVQ